MNFSIYSKRFIAVAICGALLVFKDRLPISEQQLQALLAAVGSLIVGDSINPLGAVKELLKDPRVLAAIASVALTFLQDKIPISEQDAIKLVYLVASWIVGTSIRPPDQPKMVAEGIKEKQ